MCTRQPGVFRNWFRRAKALGWLALGLPVVLTGCGGGASQKKAKDGSSQVLATPSGGPFSPTGIAGAGKAIPGEGHGHQPGAHGGLLISIGSDNYHAEAVFEKGGTLKLFLLGKDESRIQEVEEQKLTAFARPAAEAEAVEFSLTPKPQAGDSPGKTSTFEGRLPEGMAGKALEVTVQSIRIGGERFRLAFRSPGDTHAATGGGMPASLAPEAERTLFLTPGGAYTREDISANGNRVASEKFKGIRATHDASPKPGDRVCPISLTKANPAFTWTVGGRQYQFCCPPCVEEFVQTAKEKPGELKGPETYVAK